MQILSITLKNFKSHRDRHFTFQLGTNAICGENGAGKTSILEAIAWTLFNYRGDYRKDDLIRNGEGSAQVTISFVSSHDGRTYDVQRCTSKGYIIYDPQLGQRLPYNRIDEDVLPWLRQHLGVSPGTDLGRLFANTIGVPQGTFTADFLLSGEKRKQVFDAILKVEEFKQVYTRLGSLKKYSEGLVAGLKREIEQYDEILAERDTLQQEYGCVVQQIQENEASLTALDAALATLQAEKDQLSLQAKQVQDLERDLKQVQVEVEAKQREVGGQHSAIAQSQDAVQQCEQHQLGYDAYLKAEERLKELDKQGKQQRALLKQRDAEQKKLSQCQVELAKLSSQLESLSRAQHDIETLTPLVQQQDILEAQHSEAQKLLQHLKQCEIERRNLEQQVKLYRGEWRNLAQDIDRIQSLAEDVAAIPTWEQQRDRLQSQLSRVEAAQQFEQELRQIVTTASQQCDRHQADVQAALNILRELQPSLPTSSLDSLDHALATLESGVTINTDVLSAMQAILQDLSEQVSASMIKAQLKSLKTQLDKAYRAQAETQSLAAKQARQTEIQQGAEQFQGQIQSLTTELEREAAATQHVTEVAESLRVLDNPRGRCQILHKELTLKESLETDHEKHQQMQVAIQGTIAQLDTELEQFTSLDTQIEAAQQQRQEHQASYQAVLQNRAIAAQLPALQEKLQTIEAELATLIQNREQLQIAFDQASQDYDPDAWKRVEKIYGETRSRADQIRGSLPEQHKRMKDYEARLAALDHTAEKRDRAQADLKAKEKVKRFVNFARKVYKDAGPRITERYVHVISKEADRLFRELINRQNVTLTWTRDYEILVQEGAHQRRFINLSGGEQMCAALALRLALLRVLADIDIAFFDEPTTNMDRPRRASLAEAIANIRSFRQLFVISHDDTFEQFTENLVFVEREME